jgi:hypothetical protein
LKSATWGWIVSLAALGLAIGLLVPLLGQGGQPRAAP